MIFRWPRSKTARREVIAMSVAACALLARHYWHLWQDVRVVALGGRELQWRGLHVVAPAGYALVPNTSRGILALVAASDTNVQAKDHTMGLQDTTVRGDSPYAQ